MAAWRPDDEHYDRIESQGEWRAFTGTPDASDDAYWFNVVRDILAPIPPEKEEVEF